MDIWAKSKNTETERSSSRQNFRHCTGICQNMQSVATISYDIQESGIGYM